MLPFPTTLTKQTLTLSETCFLQETHTSLDLSFFVGGVEPPADDRLRFAMTSDG